MSVLRPMITAGGLMMKCAPAMVNVFVGVANVSVIRHMEVQPAVTALE